VCKGQDAGIQVYLTPADFLKDSECRAWTVGLACYSGNVGKKECCDVKKELETWVEHAKNQKKRYCGT
jgi:hypothetical protein